LKIDALIKIIEEETQRMSETFGELVRELRVSRGLSQGEVARLSGLSLGLISLIEREKNCNPSILTIGKLDKTLKAKGKLFRFWYNMRQATVTNAKSKTKVTAKIDVLEFNREDNTIEELREIMPRVTPTSANIQSKSIVSNLVRIQKLNESSDVEFAESIGVSKRVWSLAKKGGTALNSETVERIVERFPEAIPIQFDESTKRHFGQIVKRLRKQAGLTQKELAENSGLSLVLVSHVERGKNIDLSLRAIKKLDKELKAHGELEQHAFRLLFKVKGSLGRLRVWAESTSNIGGLS
jgi:transcriptional regulator with XRE-family HTH domain